MFTDKQLTQAMQGATAVPQDVITYVYQQRWLQIWVPSQYGGLGCNLTTGLKLLHRWAFIDGSLGWMLTLCAGANYFARNMQPDVAKALFEQNTTCFGGSGMIGGTADLQADGSFLINGLWHYATGAPYLSHFTLNAKVTQNGVEVLNAEGLPLVQSFVIRKDQVQIIPDWHSMGMRATNTYSFSVSDTICLQDHSFIYDTFYTTDVVSKIPFRIFADLTLLVNYLGMASHFIEEAKAIAPTLDLDELITYVANAYSEVLLQATEVEQTLKQGETNLVDLQVTIHQFGVSVVDTLSIDIMRIHNKLGIKGTQVGSQIHQIFTDFFTATLHANFRQ